MRIVFSRKGFDSAAGGGPSPIVGGRPVSLPIPDTKGHSPTTYAQRGLADHVAAASHGVLGGADLCHDDPMFLPGGTCVFGQCGGAQTHLGRQGVTTGDVFLFFGWFAGEGHGHHHRIFGYLKVAEIVRLAACDEATRARFAAHGHPHAFGFHHPSQSDTLYVGEGVAAATAPETLRLTRPGANRTQWQVPPWLAETGLSYHRDPARWPAPGHLRTVAQGQEFVADIGDRPDAHAWLAGILAAITASG